MKLSSSLCMAVLAILLALSGPSLAVADSDEANQPQDEILPAVIGYVVEQRETQAMGHPQIHQKLELIVSRGPRRGEVIIVEQTLHAFSGQAPYKAGDRVYVNESHDVDGRPAYYIVGYDRSGTLLWMALLFVALVVLVGRKRGASSLVGMALSFVIIFALVLPRIVAGQNPMTVAILGTALAMPPSYYLAHGLNRKTTVALAGSLAGLILTGTLAVLFVEVAHLTGYASGEAGFLQTMRPGELDIKGLLLAGMVIGVLGVLDDITVAQAAIVEQLRAANPSLKWRQLYSRAMQVGQDHIASMVNTLVLVYAGAALPLLILLSDRSLSLAYVLSHEVVAEEIVRMLVTSMGLVAAVPITTLLASLVMILGYEITPGSQERQ